MSVLNCRPVKVLKTKTSMEGKLQAVDLVISGKFATSLEIDGIITWLVAAVKIAPQDDAAFLLSKLAAILLNKPSSNELLNLSSTTILSLLNFIKNDNVYRQRKEYKTCADLILQLPPVASLLRENSKLLSEVFVAALNISETPCNEDISIYMSLEAIYQSLASRETTVLQFMKLALPTLGNFYATILRDREENGMLLQRQRFIQFCQSLLFSKTSTSDLSTMLNNVFTNKTFKSSKFTLLIRELSSCLRSDMAAESKEALVRLIVEALLASGKIEDLVVVRFVILLAHILSVEQMVTVTIDGKPKTLLEGSPIIEILEVGTGQTKPNFPLLNTILKVISAKSIHLGESLPGVTGLQWFQALVHRLVSKKKSFNQSTIDLLSSLFLLDSLTIEPQLSSVFSCIFAKSSNWLQPSYVTAYERFTITALRIFSRLQRCHKFLAKLLHALSSVDDIDSKEILSTTFLNNIGSTVTLLPSAHNLSILTTVLDHLEQAVEALGRGEVYTTLLQAVGNLLPVCLGSCRLICYTLPRAVIESFISHINRLKDLLTRFSSLILLLPHDRRIMQPFLRICLVWGEVQVLMDVYASDENLPMLSEDSSPSDLSPVLNFISGEQWSVFSERITNFGDEQCNRCLMKLILQKLKVAHLVGEKSHVNSGATAQYIVKRLKTDVHGLTVINVLTPEELNIVLHWLSEKEARTLVSVMYEQLENCELETFIKWVEDPILLENKKFVVHLFEVVFKFLVHSIPEENNLIHLRELHKVLGEIGSVPLSSDHVNLLREIINESFKSTLNLAAKPSITSRLERAVRGLRSLPFSFLASSFGGDVLSSITALLIAMDCPESLLQFFEILLKSTVDVTACFNIELCIYWITSRVSDKATRSSLIETLVIKSMLSENGVKQFKSLVKSFKKSSYSPVQLELEVTLYNCIRKCWGNAKHSVEKNTMLSSQRKRLVRRLISAVEEASVKDNYSKSAVLDAFAILLMIKDRKGKVEDVVAMDFDGYLSKAIAGAKESFISGGVELESCVNFLVTVLKCSTALRPVIKDGFVLKIWSELKGHDCDKLWTHVCIAASENEYTLIMDDLSNTIRAALGPPQHEDALWEDGPVLPKRLRPLFVKSRCISEKWPSALINAFRIFSVNASDTKLTIWQKTLLDLFKQANYILPLTGDHASVMNWLKFLHFITTSAQVTMNSEVHDYLLDVLFAAPTEGVPFLEHFTIRIDILSGLIGPRTAFFREKVHLVFQVFKLQLDWLVRESDTNSKLSDAEEADRAQAAFHLEKWCSVLIKKEVGREWSLFIIEIIIALTAVPLPVPVKLHLNNAVFILLRLADEHTIHFLMRLLPQGSQHIFTNLYSQFQRFYKYKGKI